MLDPVSLTTQSFSFPSVSGAGVGVRVGALGGRHVEVGHPMSHPESLARSPSPLAVSADAVLAAVYAEFSGPIHSYAYHLLGDTHDADDITQETFIRAYLALSQLRDSARVRSWLYRIATNLCMDLLRRRTRSRRIFGIALSLSPDNGDETRSVVEVADPGCAFDQVAERDHITRTLKRMPPKYAACLVLHGVQGLTYREIAEVLNITPGAAAVRLSRARDLFERHYEAVRQEDAP